MNHPVPSSELAWKTYVRAAVWMLPFTAAWVFCAIILMPAVESLWVKMGARESILKTVIEVSSASLNHGRTVMGVMVMIVVGLEVFWPAWNRWRKAAVETATYVYAIAVLLVILGVSTATVALVSWDYKQSHPPVASATTEGDSSDMSSPAQP